MDLILALGLTAIAFGNLFLPGELQSLGGADYLVLVIGLMCAAALSRLLPALSSPYPWVVGIIVVLVALPGFVVGEISSYGFTKAVTFGLVVLLLFASAALDDPPRAVRVVLTVGLALAVIVSVMVVFFGQTAENGRVSILGLNPVGVSRLAGVGLVTAAILFVGGHRGGLLSRPALVGAATITAAAVVTTGSRGPIVSALLAVGVCVVLLLVARRVRKRWIALAGVLVLVLMIAANRFGDRSVDLLGAGRGDSGRNILYDAAFLVMSQSPLGLGWGNFGTMFGWANGEIFYPHNIFLEFGSEGGMVAFVGMAAIFAGVACVGARAYLRKNSLVTLIALSLYIYALVNAQFSSDIVGNRMLWVFLAVVLALGRFEKIWSRPQVLARTQESGMS